MHFNRSKKYAVDLEVANDSGETHTDENVADETSTHRVLDAVKNMNETLQVKIYTPECSCSYFRSRRYRPIWLPYVCASGEKLKSWCCFHLNSTCRGTLKMWRMTILQRGTSISFHCAVSCRWARVRNRKERRSVSHGFCTAILVVTLGNLWNRTNEAQERTERCVLRELSAVSLNIISVFRCSAIARWNKLLEHNRLFLTHPSSTRIIVKTLYWDQYFNGHLWEIKG